MHKESIAVPQVFLGRPFSGKERFAPKGPLSSLLAIEGWHKYVVKIISSLDSPEINPSPIDLSSFSTSYQQEHLFNNHEND